MGMSLLLSNFFRPASGGGCAASGGEGDTGSILSRQADERVNSCPGDGSPGRELISIGRQSTRVYSLAIDLFRICNDANLWK